jgi:hypothetical protein
VCSSDLIGFFMRPVAVHPLGEKMPSPTTELLQGFHQPIQRTQIFDIEADDAGVQQRVADNFHGICLMAVQPQKS